MAPDRRVDHGTGDDLVEVVRRPTRLFEMDEGRLDRVLRMARRAMLLPRVAASLDGIGGFERLPEKAADALRAALRTAEHHRRNLRWEGNRIARALDPLDVPTVLLKGAAYEFAGLPPAVGRMASDVDLLVPVDRIGDVEAALHRAGWRTDRPDPYDQRYYRRWMHELPPLRHEGRGTLVDVHHTLAPRTSRSVRPDVDRLWREIRPIAGSSFSRLGDADLVVHSAIHAFHDGDLSEALRDLVDLDDLLRHFGSRDERFWDRLVDRAEIHRAGRPVHHAIRWSRSVFGTPVPARTISRLAPWAPSPGVGARMDEMIDDVLYPWIDGAPPVRVEWARFALFVRSHWCRMPVHLLLPHLARKGWHRLRARKDGTGM